LGAVTALGHRGDAVLADRLNHASLVDAARLSGARVLRYRHGSLEHLDILADKASGERLIVSDGVFSMDGDLAPLPGLVAAAQRHEARLVVDDAHGLGVMGETGRGSLEHF
ncbi:MAG: aminotransferase class I/II-fold pyridoxal phosphate-dependent enzyme, partial [Gammaproteobacteria bacterium]|nr:aminotransferase class I/II-fold pyridoxal phosphate-dependent enzyme [Gammaproteobacteria bacterium]NIR97350.1 aminotransferase class I/II-fold pyridoxal phosphate-dependent enzyme [Gammaproteobacteria bacterium]NIT64109.1 aminotransferase class I/II-fold pyridoxal phosphate-dependent enzyme [Gammaproteobacteria bacterium]NIV21039.1 aminotransferase class I/II-fold pyridoxal phosphate-dependent enzyme [Gammaproteobacteria bacterium]NIY32689.1 aminotransferase class I/II-fold pyridoxal phosp